MQDLPDQAGPDRIHFQTQALLLHLFHKEVLRKGGNEPEILK